MGDCTPTCPFHWLVMARYSMTLSAAWGLPNMGERLISAWCYADVTVSVDPESALMSGGMLHAVTVSGYGSVVGHGCECCCMVIWQRLDGLQAPVHLGADQNVFQAQPLVS